MAHTRATSNRPVASSLISLMELWPGAWSFLVAWEQCASFLLSSSRCRLVWRHWRMVLESACVQLEDIFEERHDKDRLSTVRENKLIMQLGGFRYSRAVRVFPFGAVSPGLRRNDILPRTALITLLSNHRCPPMFQKRREAAWHSIQYDSR